MAESPTILIADDEEEISLICRRLLESAGYAVLTATTPVEARAQAEKGIDLLLTDVVLGDASAPEVVTTVRAAVPAVPVIYMSGDSAAREKHPGIAINAAFLEKPFSRDELLRAVRAALDG